MALTRCPQCGRVADPPSCFACGYEWSTEATAAPAAAETPAAVPEAWSVPAVGSAPLKTPEPIAELTPEAPHTPSPEPETPATRNVVQISDSLDELGDIFGNAPDGSPGVAAFSDVPLPELDDDDDDLDASISELENELAAAAVPMDDAPASLPAEPDEEDPFAAFENAFGEPPARSPSGSVPLPEFHADDSESLVPEDTSLPVVQAMPEPEGAEGPTGGLPVDLFAEVEVDDDDLAPTPAGPPPAVPAPPVAFAIPDPNDEEIELDGLDLDAFDLMEHDDGPPLLEPEPPDEADAFGLLVDDEGPPLLEPEAFDPPPPTPSRVPEALGPLPGLDRQSADELATYKERLESYAENFEVEGRIGEAAFLYELKAFLDTLD